MVPLPRRLRRTRVQTEATGRHRRFLLVKRRALTAGSKRPQDLRRPEPPHPLRPEGADQRGERNDRSQIFKPMYVLSLMIFSSEHAAKATERGHSLKI